MSAAVLDLLVPRHLAPNNPTLAIQRVHTPRPLHPTFNTIVCRSVLSHSSSGRPRSADGTTVVVLWDRTWYWTTTAFVSGFLSLDSELAAGVLGSCERVLASEVQ